MRWGWEGGKLGKFWDGVSGVGWEEMFVVVVERMDSLEMLGVEGILVVVLVDGDGGWTEDKSYGCDRSGGGGGVGRFWSL